jgi:ribonuclease VapC
MRFNPAIDADDTRLRPVASFIKAAIVMQACHGDGGVRQLDLFLARANVELAPVDSNQAHIARQVFRHYGKGRHPATLNAGDGCTYALAQDTGEPLLFQGDDLI